MTVTGAVTHDPNINAAGANHVSTYHDEVIGGQSVLAYVDIADGRPRKVVFRSDMLGQVFRRDEKDNLSGGDPHDGPLPWPSPPKFDPPDRIFASRPAPKGIAIAAARWAMSAISACAKASADKTARWMSITSAPSPNKTTFYFEGRPVWR